MKNFGFKNLSVVSQNSLFPTINKTTAGAFDIINQTKVFNDTENAISKFDIVISLSARKRHINKKHITINDLLNILFTYREKKIGFMFGPEASGLSNHDLSYSNYILQIPTVSNFKSINLSHSVTIICFEIFKILNKKSFKVKGKNIKISSKSKISSIINYLINLLNQKNSLNLRKKEVHDIEYQ